MSGAIESAQKKVEGHHFDVRKHVVQYDDVMNKQREIIYKRRRNILKQGDIHLDVLKWIENEVEILANLHIRGREPHKFELEEFANGVSALHKDGAPTKEKYQNIEIESDIIEEAKKFLLKRFDEKEKDLPDPKFLKEAEREITLRTIDRFWMDHIDEMTHLREQVSLRAYAQKNPLHEYQGEGYEKFKTLLQKIQSSVVRTLLQMNIQVKFGDEMADDMPKNLVTNAEKIAQALTARETVDKAGPHRVRASRPQEINSETGRVRADLAVKSDGLKVGRNDECPCGSGKKYKKCCGRGE